MFVSFSLHQYNNTENNDVLNIPLIQDIVFDESKQLQLIKLYYYFHLTLARLFHFSYRVLPPFISFPN